MSNYIKSDNTNNKNTYTAAIKIVNDSIMSCVANAYMELNYGFAFVQPKKNCDSCRIFTNTHNAYVIMLCGTWKRNFLFGSLF